MIKLKRSSGHIEMDIGDATLYLTPKQAVMLGTQLIMASNPNILEMTLEPEQYRDVSKDGTVSEPLKRPFNVPPMQCDQNPKPE